MSSDKAMATAPSADALGTVPAPSPASAALPPDVRPATAELLKVLADGTRRQIFLVIIRGEVCNCELSEMLGLPQNLVSHHLRKLRQAGLVEEHRDPHDGRWAHITVNLEALSAAWEGLEEALHPSRVGWHAPACQVRAKKLGPAVSLQSGAGSTSKRGGPT